MFDRLLTDAEFSEIKNNFFYPNEDEAIKKKYAHDFGGITSRLPKAVFIPDTTNQLHLFIKLINRYKIKVTCRGQGHSANGQSLCEDGVVIDLKNLNKNFEFSNPQKKDAIIVTGNATWKEVVTFTLKHELTVPVLTDYLGLSVFGTLSLGGLGGSTYLKGTQADNVLSLDILTLEGKLVTCSNDQNSELFHAALCGLGQVGFIISATLPLIKAKPHAQLYLLSYRDAKTFLKDQKLLYSKGEFDHLQGLINKQDKEWVYVIHAAIFHDKEEKNASPNLLENTSPNKIEKNEMSYFDFVNQVTVFIDLISKANKLDVPHPWYNVLVPENAMADHLQTALKSPNLTGNEPIILYPINTENLRQPLFIRPKGKTVYLFGLLYNCSLDANPAISYKAILQQNKELYADVKMKGGCRYPTDATPFNESDWKEHFGNLWKPFCDLKTKYDPHNLLATGVGIHRIVKKGQFNRTSFFKPIIIGVSAVVLGLTLLKIASGESETLNKPK